MNDEVVLEHIKALLEEKVKAGIGPTDILVSNVLFKEYPEDQNKDLSRSLNRLFKSKVIHVGLTMGNRKYIKVM